MINWAKDYYKFITHNRLIWYVLWKCVNRSPKWKWSKWIWQLPLLTWNHVVSDSNFDCWEISWHQLVPLDKLLSLLVIYCRSLRNFICTTKVFVCGKFNCYFEHVHWQSFYHTQKCYTAQKLRGHVVWICILTACLLKLQISHLRLNTWPEDMRPKAYFYV